MGFDNIAVSGLRRLSMMTIEQPRETPADVGASILLERIESGDAGPPRRVRLAPQLVVPSTAAVA